MNSWQGQDDFWNSFGIPAYDETSAFTKGDALSYPHITYEAVDGAAFQVVQASASIWYRTNTLKGIKEKADEIRKRFEPHLLLRIDRGYMLYTLPESIPFARVIASGDSDTMIKRILLTFNVEFLHH